MRRSGRLLTLSHDRAKGEEAKVTVTVTGKQAEEEKENPAAVDKSAEVVEKVVQPVKIRLNHSASSHSSSSGNEVLKLRFLLHSSNYSTSSTTTSSTSSLGTPTTAKPDKKGNPKDDRPRKCKKKKKKRPKSMEGFCHECGKLGRVKKPLLHCSRPHCKLAFHADCLLMPVASSANRKWCCPCHVDVVAEAAFPKDFDVHRLPAQPITLLRGMKCKEQQAASVPSAAVPAAIVSVYKDRLSAYNLPFIT